MARVRNQPFALSAWPALAGAVGTACGIPAPVQPREAVDWEGFLALAARHRVQALVHHSGWARAHGAPEGVCEALAAAAWRTARQTLRHLAVQRDVVELLETAGVPVVVLKGPPVAQEAYGREVVREDHDVDLLIAPRDVALAVRALEHHGLTWGGLNVRDTTADVGARRAQLAYAERLPLVKDTKFDWRDVSVEVHWRLAENDRLMPVHDCWLRRPRRVAVAGVLAPVLPVEAGWHYLLVHGSRHHWMRLKWLADVTALALRRPELVTREALEPLAASGLERCVASGLLVAERVLGRFLDDDARAWAGRTPGTALLVRNALTWLARDEAGLAQTPVTALPRLLAARLLLRADRGYRLAEARRMLLEAGHAYTVPDPGATMLLAGPVRWIARRR